MTKRRESMQEFLKMFTEALKARGMELPKDFRLTEISVDKDGKMVERNITPDGESPSVHIHRALDLKLVEALRSWSESQDLTVMQVLSALAYTLALKLYYECATEDEVCTISQDFERYIHQTVHALHRQYGPPKKDADVEK